MGVCKYCGKPAGFLRSYHPECHAKYLQGKVKIKELIRDAINTQRNIHDFYERTKEISIHSFISIELFKEILIDEIKNKIKSLYSQNQLTEEIKEYTKQLFDFFKIDGEILEKEYSNYSSPFREVAEKNNKENLYNLPHPSLELIYSDDSMKYPLEYLSEKIRIIDIQTEQQDSFIPEIFAIKQYEEKGYKALWTENKYWWMILGILFWEVIFAEVDEAVSYRGIGLSTMDENFTEIFRIYIEENGMPMDFFKPDFYLHRRDLIEERIERIIYLEKEELEEEFKSLYKKYYGQKFRLIENWDAFSLSDLLASINKLENKALAGILNNILLDINHHRSGLPDLIVYNENEFFFAEVKKAKDTISKKQLKWHLYLTQDLDIPVELFLINHSKRSISTIKKKYIQGSLKGIKFTFMDSKSKSFEEALSIAQKEPTFKKEEKKEKNIYSVIFPNYRYRDILNFINKAGRLKSLSISIGEETYTTTELRKFLHCCDLRNENVSLGFLYCKNTHPYFTYSELIECKNFKIFEMDSGIWRKYGYIDTEQEIWIFDLSKLKEDIEKEFKMLKACPYFTEKKKETIEKIYESLPTFVNPKENPEWGLINSVGGIWIWDGFEWINPYKEPFPGINSIIGVQKISKKERERIIDSYYK